MPNLILSSTCPLCGAVPLSTSKTGFLDINAIAIYCINVYLPW